MVIFIMISFFLLVKKWCQKCHAMSCHVMPCHAMSCHAILHAMMMLSVVSALGSCKLAWRNAGGSFQFGMPNGRCQIYHPLAAPWLEGAGRCYVKKRILTHLATKNNTATASQPPRHAQQRKRGAEHVRLRSLQGLYVGSSRMAGVQTSN